MMVLVRGRGWFITDSLELLPSKRGTFLVVLPTPLAVPGSFHQDVWEIAEPVSFACRVRLASYRFLSRRYWLIIRVYERLTSFKMLRLAARAAFELRPNAFPLEQAGLHAITAIA